MADAITVDILTGQNTVASSLEDIEKMASASIKSLTTMAAAAAAAAAAIGAVVLHKSIEAASQYEDAVNQLNIALFASGRYSVDASEGFREYADAIQKTTKYSDEQVLSSAALIQNLARLSNDGLKQATTAALNLSSALNIDLNAASTLIGKAANGNVEAFARYGIVIRKGTTDTETFANALKTLQSRFPDAAEAAAKTFTGATAKLGNAFDDIFKEIGRSFTKSPALIAAFNFISKSFFDISETIKKSIGSTDLLKDLIINFSIVMQAGIETARQIGLSFELAFQRALQAWYVLKVATTLGLSDTFNKQLMDINTQIDKTKAKFADQSTVTTWFDNLILKVTETSGHLTSFTDNMQGIPGAVVAPLTEFQKMLDSLAASIRQKLASGISTGIQAAVFALRAGKNAFQAFGSAILGMVGDMLIQIGEALILTGIGMEAVRASIVGMTGGPAIFAGVALVALGALLKSFSSGGAASGGGGSSGGGGGSTASATDMPGQQDDVTGIERKKPETNITIQVQGNILDRRQTGLEIAEVMQETFGTNGINYNT